MVVLASLRFDHEGKLPVRGAARQWWAEPWDPQLI